MDSIGRIVWPILGILDIVVSVCLLIATIMISKMRRSPDHNIRELADNQLSLIVIGFWIIWGFFSLLLLHARFFHS